MSATGSARADSFGGGRARRPRSSSTAPTGSREIRKAGFVVLVEGESRPLDAHAPQLPGGRRAGCGNVERRARSAARRDRRSSTSSSNPTRAVRRSFASCATRRFGRVFVWSGCRRRTSPSCTCSTRPLSRNDSARRWTVRRHCSPSTRSGDRPRRLPSGTAAAGSRSSPTSSARSSLSSVRAGSSDRSARRS